MNNVALTYQNKATQRTSKFFAFFSALCLVISYTCGLRIVTSVNKGLLQVLFVHVFVLFYEKVKKQNKDVLAYFFEQTNKHIISMTFGLCLFALITLIGLTREAPPFR